MLCFSYVANNKKILHDSRNSLLLCKSATTIDARYFSAKIIVNEVTPNKNDFDDLTEFNMAVVGNPLVNHLIPVWILIEPKISANIDISMAINIEAA